MDFMSMKSQTYMICLISKQYELRIRRQK